MSVNKKFELGVEYMRNAEKSLKTSLFKWRPDYEIAAEEYNKAATSFRNAKAFDQCRDCLLKVAECHKQNRALFHAARAIDQAILASKELGDLSEIPLLAERAANLYHTHGSADTAAASLDKAAKILEHQHPDHALHLYLRAADIANMQDSTRQAAEFTSKISRLYVKLKLYEKAADSIRHEIGLLQQSEGFQAVGRLVVALVLVQIARGDVVAAEKAFKEFGNYCEAPEVQTLEMLLQGYDDEDPDMAKRALNNPFIKYMDVEYAILARDLPLPQGIIVPPVKENVTLPNVSTTIPSKVQSVDKGVEEAIKEENEDDYEGGLC